MQKTSAQTNRDLREFAFILTIGFLIFGAVIPYLKGRSLHYTLIYVSFVILAIGIFVPKLLIYPKKWWMAIGDVLGKINSTILFTIIYFFIFATIGLIFRIFKRDRLKTGFRKISTTMVMKSEISPFTDPF